MTILLRFISPISLIFIIVACQNLIFSIGIFLAVAALWLMPLTGFILQAGCFFAVGFFCFWASNVNWYGSS